MRVAPRYISRSRKAALLSELHRAKTAGPLEDPVCSPDCPDIASVHKCDRFCVNASRRLSSEGDSYPLEAGITPLVFELKKLGVFGPCWSCEGHMNPKGEMWKIPRVWFYSDSLVHVRALAATVGRLYDTGTLSVPWQIVLGHSDPDNPETTFSLEPSQEHGVPILEKLHSDILVIAGDLETGFSQACNKLIAHVT